MAAVKSLQSFEMREEASLINWLSRLAERQILAAADYHGAKKRDQRRNVTLTSSLDSSQNLRTSTIPDDRAPLPLDATASEEEQKIVEECLHNRPEEYRELILLRNYAGASWETVAEETGRPSAAAARMMHARALVELGKLIREKGAG